MVREVSGDDKTNNLMKEGCLVLKVSRWECLIT